MRKLELRRIMLIPIIVGTFVLGVYIGLILESQGRGSLLQTPPASVATSTGMERFSTLAAKEGGGSSQAGVAVTSYAIPEGRKIIYEGYVRLRVGEGVVERVAEELARVAFRLGGYVGEMSLREDGGYVVLRVPSERFDEALEEVKKLGTAIEERTWARDVTEEYVDLRARLNASLALEQRLLRLLEQAKTVEEMLKVEEYLSRVRSQIEIYTAQLKNLERMIQYSTIYVYIEAPPKEVKPIVQFPSFDPLPAIAGALSLLYSVIYAFITALIGLSPLALIGATGYLGYRKLRRRQVAEKRVETPSS